MSAQACVCMCVRPHKYACKCVHACVHMFVCVRTHVPVCLSVCVSVCVWRKAEDCWSIKTSSCWDCCALGSEPVCNHYRTAWAKLLVAILVMSIPRACLKGGHVASFSPLWCKRCLFWNQAELSLKGESIKLSTTYSLITRTIRNSGSWTGKKSIRNIWSTLEGL